MRKLDKELVNRSINLEKLLAYGFNKNNNYYIYEHDLSDNNFKVVIKLSDDKMTSQVIDKLSDLEYLPVDIPYSSGEFVGRIKTEYEEILKDIIDKCTIPSVFTSNYSKKVINYVKEKYNDNLEYLWEKFPKNAVYRHKENKKWYAIILTVSKRKLGFDDDAEVEIIDLRNTPKDIDNIVDNKYFFPGYHMNKHHWFTIILDGSVPIQEIYKYIDISYNIK